MTKTDEKKLNDRELELLKELVKDYHTLPLSLEELKNLLKSRYDVKEVYALLSKVVEERLLNSAYFAKRYLVYLNLLKVKELLKVNKR